MESIELLKKRLAREVRARRDAEQLLETKSRDLFDANLKLSQLTRELQDEVRNRTSELLAAQRAGKIGTFVKNLRTGESNYSEWAFRLYGLDPECANESLQSAEALVHPDDIAKFRSRLKQLISQDAEPGGEQSGEYRIVKADGSIAWLRAHWEFREGESGSDPLLTGTVQDITAQKEAEAEINSSYRQVQARISELEQTREALARARDEAQESERLKSRFLAIMSHEIRTPLNGVLGALQLLGDNALDEKQSRLLRLALSSAEGLRTLTNDVIELSRLEAGRLELEIAPFDVYELVSEICMFWHPLARRKGLMLEFNAQPDLPQRVHGDPARLRQILNNFLSNAIRFTERGRVDVWLGLDDATAPGAPGQASFRIDVQDTGIGIARADQQRLFEDFSQLSQPGAGEGRGAGLGLAICRELSGLMNGTVGVSSAAGAGSMFWFRLPLQIDTSPVVATTQKPKAFATLTTSAGQAPRVLVAEDVPTNQLIVQMLLESFGCHVDMVGNGAEAVNALANGSYDLVLMDVAMPVMDGVEATRRIRAMQDKRASIPIIGLTAFALPEEQERFKEAGMNHILSKPMQRAALHATLASALASPGASTVRSILPQATPINELDTQALAEMTQGLSPSQLGELLGRVAEDIGTHTALALDCVNAGNTEGLARSCHVLKGLAGSFGNRELSLLTKRIEQHCRDGNIQAAISATLSDLDRMSRSAQVALDNYQRMKVTDNARGA